MEICQYFKSVLEQDTAPVVICDLEHTVLYMNPAACQRYSKVGGSQLLGTNLLKCHSGKSKDAICQVLKWFQKSPENNRVRTFYYSKENKDVYMIALRDDSGKLIGYYEKHEYRNPDDLPLYDMRNG